MAKGAGWTLAGVQAAGVVVALGWLALRPPAEGVLWLVPLTPAAEARIVPETLGSGALIIAKGPLGGSLVVRGTRARLPADPAMLVLAAPPRLCGGEAA
jgi:hypothetical protein